MSAPSTSTPTVQIGTKTVLLRDGETVLEGLERADVDVPSGCRAGTCTKCIVRAVEGAPPPQSQKGLRSTLVEQGYFLACQARPEGLLRLQEDSAGPEPVDAAVEELRRVAPGVVRILLRPETPFDFRPGQYLDVLHPEGSARSYSIASLPSSGLLELHVRQVPEGLVSGWLHGRSVGDAVRVRGPFGQCFLVPDEPEKKLLLVGAGTGLAPLLGIARDAQRTGHRGAVDLIHGGLVPERLYLRDELQELADGWPQLSVHHCVLRDATEREHAGALDEVAVQIAGSLDDTRAFLCGDDAIVRALRRRLFLAGLASQEILADPFVPSAC